MFAHKKIKVGKRHIEAIVTSLGNKNLVLLKGSKGYVMCGYLNMKAAQKFKDVAVMIKGVSSITQSLKTVAYDCSPEASRLGIYKGQPIKEVLGIIA